MLLEKMMGEERFAEWQDIRDARQFGLADISEEYELLKTRDEASLVFSPQAEVMWEVYHWLDKKAEAFVQDGYKLLDLGCGPGLLVSWFAKQFPKLKILGADNSDSLLNIAATEANPNSTFQRWDYSNSQASENIVSNLLFCSLGIDFNLTDAKYSLECSDTRSTEQYHLRYDEAKPYFKNWRSACMPEGRLFAVLRIPSFSHFLAVIDAATDSGWNFELSSSEKLFIGEESLPAIQFFAADSERVPEDLLGAFWLRDKIESTFGSIIQDPLAGKFYKLLIPKAEIARGDRTFDDGHTMRTVVGLTGVFAYRYSYATTGLERLQLRPATKLDELKVSFDWFDVAQSPENFASKPSRKTRRR